MMVRISSGSSTVYSPSNRHLVLWPLPSRRLGHGVKYGHKSDWCIPSGMRLPVSIQTCCDRMKDWLVETHAALAFFLGKTPSSLRGGAAPGQLASPNQE